jgi:hypothetical protein
MQCINRGYLGKQTSREKREDKKKKKQYRVLICILYIMHSHSDHYILAMCGVAGVRQVSLGMAAMHTVRAVSKTKIRFFVQFK